MPSREEVRAVLDTYIRAWETQDPDLIYTIFTDNATYHERVLQEPIGPGLDKIRHYWETKVAEEEANIRAELLNFYIGGDVAAEQEAHFDDIVKSERKRMLEVAILTFEDGKISSLREYWASEPIGQIESAPG